MKTESLFENENSIAIVRMDDLKKIVKMAVAEARAEREAEMDAQRNEEYYSIDEVAEMMNVDKTTLWRWRNEGILTATKRGRRVLYRKSDITNFKQ